MSLLTALFRKPQQAALPATPVELVGYAIGLASNSDAIAAHLDNLRTISAKYGPGEKPSPQDSQKILDIYLNIEAYLTTKEPLRTFTKDGLRKNIDPALLKELANYESSKT